MTNEGIASLCQFKNRQNSLNPQSAIRNPNSLFRLRQLIFPDRFHVLRGIRLRPRFGFLPFRHRIITGIPKNVPTIFEVTLDIVEARILAGLNRYDIAGDQRLQIAGKFPAAATG